MYIYISSIDGIILCTNNYISSYINNININNNDIATLIVATGKAAKIMNDNKGIVS